MHSIFYCFFLQLIAVYSLRIHLTEIKDVNRFVTSVYGLEKLEENNLQQFEFDCELKEGPLVENFERTIKEMSMRNIGFRGFRKGVIPPFARLDTSRVTLDMSVCDVFDLVAKYAKLKVSLF
jgi:hypothetical protein